MTTGKIMWGIVILIMIFGSLIFIKDITDGKGN